MFKPTARRQFLRGAGGFAIGLPFLESLVPRQANAATAFTQPKRYFLLAQMHGGVWAKNSFPDPTGLTETTTAYPGHDIRRGKLVRKVDGEFASVSPWLRAKSSELSETMVRKMNVLQGLDVPTGISHNDGSPLGNYGNNLGTPYRQVPTLDQVLAWSPSFYGDLQAAGVRSRNVAFDALKPISFGWSNPGAKSGNIQGLASQFHLGGLYQSLFGDRPAMGAVAGQPQRASIVDKVLADYKRLRQSSTRMSAGDKQRLDDHMDRLSEMERQTAAAMKISASCKAPPFGPYGYVPIDDMSRLNTAIDMIATAFICGTTRIAAGWVPESAPYGLSAGDWHQGVAHIADVNADAQAKMLEQARTPLFGGVLRLANALEAVEDGPGTTMLDNSLLTTSAESGVRTHDSISVPVLTIGSAGGALNTGWHCDYRNKVPSSLRALETGSIKEYAGLFYAQWLATAGRALGLSPADWQFDNKPGYGVVNVGQSYAKSYVSGVAEGASMPLPFLAGPKMPT